MIQIIIFLTMLFLISTNSEANSIFNRTTWGVLIYYVVKTIVSGPLGEELGGGFCINGAPEKILAIKIFNHYWFLVGNVASAYMVYYRFYRQ